MTGEQKRKTLLWALAAAGVLTLSGCDNGSNAPPTPPQPTPSGDISLPALPPNRRNKLYYGYYGGNDQQTDEVADHTNMWFEACWGGVDVGIRHMQKMQLPTIFNLDYALFTTTNPRRYVGADIATQQLQDTFNQLKAADVLKYIVALYPIDEPDLSSNNVSTADLLAANQIVRAIASSYPELQSVKLCVTYCAHSDYRAVNDFDWVGFDDYGAGATIFTNGQYATLKKVLRPTQGITLFPGGAAPWMNDPKPFYRKAVEDDQVVAIIPFIWFDNYADTTYAGIRTVCPAVYREVGTMVKNG